MNLSKLKLNQAKLQKLSTIQLTHILQLIDDEISNYNRACSNYNKEKYERFSVPYLKGWTDFRDNVTKHLSEKE